MQGEGEVGSSGGRPSAILVSSEEKSHKRTLDKMTEAIDELQVQSESMRDELAAAERVRPLPRDPLDAAAAGPDPAAGDDAGEAREGGAEGHHRRHCAILDASRRAPCLTSGGRGAAGRAAAGSAAVARALAQADAEPEQGLSAGDREGRDGPSVRQHPDPLEFTLAQMSVRGKGGEEGEKRPR